MIMTLCYFRVEKLNVFRQNASATAVNAAVADFVVIDAVVCIVY